MRAIENFPQPPDPGDEEDEAEPAEHLDGQRAFLLAIQRNTSRARTFCQETMARLAS